jgi:hypothetical protein
MMRRFTGTDVTVVLKLGPIDTHMTSHLTGKGAKLASVVGVAKLNVEGTKSMN